MTTSGADNATASSDPPEIPAYRGAEFGQRASTIATIHAAADWLAEHTSDPHPTHVEFSHHVHGGDVTERLGQIHAFADAHDLRVEQHGSTVWATLTLASQEAHGVRIQLSVLTTTQQRKHEWP